MKSLISKVRWIATAGGNPVNWKPANRIANLGLAGAVLFFVAKQHVAFQAECESRECAEENLNQVRHFLVLERAHVKKLCELEEAGGVK